MIRELNKLSLYIKEMQDEIRKEYPRTKTPREHKLFLEYRDAYLTRIINYMIMWQEFASNTPDDLLIIRHNRNIHDVTRSIGLMIDINFKYDEQKEFANEAIQI